MNLVVNEETLNKFVFNFLRYLEEDQEVKKKLITVEKCGFNEVE